MAKFIYKMQNILNLKLKLEEQAKIAFAVENQKLKAEQEKLEQIYKESHFYMQILKNFTGGRLDLLEMRRCSEAVELKKQQASEQKKQIKIAERNVEIARQKLNNVMVERKTQEKLKERAFEEFVKELNAEEKKTTDELTSYQYNGNGKEIEDA